MRVLVVLYHVGDALARSMERVDVPSSIVQTWCTDWEEALTNCANMKGLGWVGYADSLIRLINRYHLHMSEMEPISGQ